MTFFTYLQVDLVILLFIIWVALLL